MTSRTLLLSLLAVLELGLPVAGQVKPSGGTPPAATTRRSEKDDPQARRDATRAWFGGEPTPAYLDAKREVSREVLRRFDWSFPGSPRPRAPAVPGSGLTWTNLGPTQGSTLYAPNGGGDVDSGRLAIQGVVTHPTNSQILYIATAGGGVWKATNADLNAAGDWNWTCITDNLPASTATGNCAVGALAMSPADPETLFLGLGDYFAAQGRGLYKSTNGGASWTEVSVLGNTTAIMCILAVDANIILVGGNDGIWRSTNGGASFSQLGGSAGLEVWSLVKLGAMDLAASLTQSGFANGQIFYSSDAGLNFTQATGNSGSGRITLATSPASGTTIWGIEQDATPPSNGSNFFKGLLKSTNKGATWSYVTAPAGAGSLFQSVGSTGAGDGGQAFYNHLIAVDPADANRIFVGSNLALYRTLDGGVSWQQMTQWLSEGRVYAHADFHTAAWSKTGTKVLFFGNDGGLSILRDPYRTPPTGPLVPSPLDPGLMQVQSDPTFLDTRRNRGLITHLVYNLGSTTATGSRWKVSAGLQDNSNRIRGGAGSSAFNDVTTMGDGFGNLWHPANGDKVMVAQYMVGPDTAKRPGLKRSVDGGSTFASIGQTIGDPDGSPFWTRLVGGLGDATGETVLTATNRYIWITRDFGTTWSQLNAAPFGGSVRNMGASKTNPLAFGVLLGGIGGRSVDNGATWQQFGAFPGIDLTTGNTGYVSPSYIWFDTSNGNTIYVASASITMGASHLWKSTDGGATWTALDGAGNGFPAGPVHVIQNDPTAPTTLLAGTDYGVFISTNGGSTWSRYGQGMPMVAVRDLYIAPDGKFIRAATFGRGVWEIGDATEGGGGGTTTQLLQNPGFESGNNGAWTTSTTQGSNAIIDPTNNPANSHSGSLYAWLCGWSSTTTETLYQQVAVPAGANPVTLKFWLSIGTNEGGVPNDTLKLEIRNSSGGLLQTLQTWSNLDAGTWAQKTFDLTSYAGQTIRVHFIAQENASAGTSFFLDDFELNATTSTATAPSITQHPQSLSVAQGQAAVFNVAATGTAPLAYQWRKGGAPLAGATSATLSITSAQPGDAGTYDVVVSNGAGSATSNAATLTVTGGTTPPTITGHPGNQSVTAGQTATFTVVATGSAPLAYQWRRNGSPIGGASGATYAFTASYGDNGATYSVVVTNGAGSATSNNATLTVAPKNRDLSGDGTTNVLDLATLMAAYSGSGVPTANPAADLDGDGDCDDADLTLLLAAI